MAGVKQSLYFPAEMLVEIEREAKRLSRPLSWMIQTAWKVSRRRMEESITADEIIKQAIEDHERKR